MNILDQRAESLAQTHHAPILKAVLAALETTNPFAWRRTARRLMLDADRIAENMLASIIGDESVGVVAWQSHPNRFLRFNFLSFLTMARNDILATPEKRGES